MRHEVERQTEVTARLQREVDHTKHSAFSNHQTILTREDNHTDDDENGTTG